MWQSYTLFKYLVYRTRSLVTVWHFITVSRTYLFVKMFDDVISHVIFGFGHPIKNPSHGYAKIQEIFMFGYFSFNQSKNKAVLKSRTGHFRGLVGFEAPAKNFKMCSQGRPRGYKDVFKDSTSGTQCFSVRNRSPSSALYYCNLQLRSADNNSKHAWKRIT